MSELPPDSRPVPPAEGPEPTTAMPTQDQPSRMRRVRDRLWAARVLIGVALASLIVGAAGAGGVVALTGGDDDGDRGDGRRGGHGDHGRMDKGRGFDQRGGPGDFRGPASPTPSS